MAIRFSAFLVLTLLCILHAVPSSAQRAGMLTDATGGVWADRGGQRVPLAIKAEIDTLDVLNTDGAGKATILFDDDTTLSMGPSATVAVRDFAFGTGAKPALAVHLVQGASRIVSGKVVEQNPEGFKITSPLAVIGIRGTVTQSNVRTTEEYHFVEHLDPGHYVFVQGEDGYVLRLTESMTGVLLRRGQSTPHEPRRMTPEERERGVAETLIERPARGHGLRELAQPDGHDIIERGQEVGQEQGVIDRGSYRGSYPGGGGSNPDSYVP